MSIPPRRRRSPARGRSGSAPPKSVARRAAEPPQIRDEVERARGEEAELLELTAAMSTELQLHPLLVRIMDTVTRLLGAERATLFVHDPDRNELWALAGQGEALSEIRFPVTAGIAGHVFTTGETISIPDAYADGRFNPELDKRTGFRTRSILCMPVVSRSGQTVAVTQVLNRKDGPFTLHDEQRLRAFSAQASVALDRAQLFEAFLEKERLEGSLRLAHEIQVGMLPRVFPRAPEFELAAELRPARSVGGDLYDFLLLGDRLWFLVGDVSGKGVGAALVMAVTRTLFRASFQTATTLSAVLEGVNRELSRDNDRGLFVTVFAGSLEIRTGQLVYGNAGHNLPFRTAPGRPPSPLRGARGMAMGVIASQEYPTETVRLEPGEGLFLFTDGVTEALNTAGEQYSVTRLAAALSRLAGAPAAEVVRSILAEAQAFTRGTPPSDDIAVMALRYLGGASGRGAD